VSWNLVIHAIVVEVRGIDQEGGISEGRWGSTDSQTSSYRLSGLGATLPRVDIQKVHFHLQVCSEREVVLLGARPDPKKSISRLVPSKEASSVRGPDRRARTSHDRCWSCPSSARDGIGGQGGSCNGLLTRRGGSVVVAVGSLFRFNAALVDRHRSSLLPPILHLSELDLGGSYRTGWAG
jgi:hypothetical protein